MDSSHVDEAEKSSPETGSDSSMSPCSSDNDDIFGDPLIHPRVGEQYQVEIPSILSESERLLLMKKSAGSENIHSSYSFWCGLPIPVMSLCNQANLIKTVKVENSDLVVTTEDSSGMKEPYVKVETPDQASVGNGYCLVPGQPTKPWSDFEADCFLLGLYLLGKNLLQVARFVESKGMGHILAYYYGQFYASAGYIRWSESRKMKSKKCVVGHRFFTGYRQLELFSRLFPHLSEENKIKLSEASKAFTEGSSSLDEYVFTLKAMVGMNALVDAVGIGKGKEDLTTLILDGSKNNHVISHRSEMPSVKACSALTCAEITNYLTGDFRLSKAKSNDLFWEAVWPRLLARGWHSEQPLGNGYKGSNHLVFLMPGIKKFSRRKLSKGDHYFDSISDVLAKIASEPELLQLEDDKTNCSSSKVKSDDDRDSSDNESHCYLQPQVSSGILDLRKFTIVDTSLADEENPYKLIELRSLPVEDKRCFPLSGQIKKAETKSPITADVPSSDILSSTLFAHLRESSIDIFGNQRIPNGNHNPMNHKPRTQQFSRHLKHGLSQSSCEGRVKKRRRLSSCVEADVTFVLALPARTRNATLRIVGPKLSQTAEKQASEILLVAENNTENRVQDSLNLNHSGPTISRENEKTSSEKQAIDQNLSQKHGKAKVTDVEKTKHFEPEKQKCCDVKEQRCSDFQIRITCDAKKPKHSLKEKQKVSMMTDVEKTKHFDPEKQKRYDIAEQRCSNFEIRTTCDAKKPKHSLNEKRKVSKMTDVEKTKHFDPEKQKCYDIAEQRCSDFEIRTTCDAKKPKHSLKEKQKVSRMTDAEKTKHFDPEKKKRYDIAEQRGSDFEIQTTCDAKKPKHSLKEKQKVSKMTDVEKTKYFDPEKQKCCDVQEQRCSDFEIRTTCDAKKPKPSLKEKQKVSKMADVEKTKHFDPEKQKRCGVEEQRCSDFEIRTTCDVKKPRHSLKEKQKVSKMTVVLDHVEPQVNFASRETAKAVLYSAQKPDRKLVAPKQKISGDNDGPSNNMQPRVNSASEEPSNLVLDSDQQTEMHFVAQKQESCEDTVRHADKTEPSNMVLESDQQPERHLITPKQEICGDTGGPSNDMEPQASSASAEPDNKAVNPGQQSRRQSTRSRPLTTKALEALELGFLSPVRRYRKRSPSVAQDQKPKRSRQPRNKSNMFPQDMILDVTDTCDVNL
ncbi:hypothetical protein vseg_008321 [Gypsophila vaccaria]